MNTSRMFIDGRLTLPIYGLIIRKVYIRNASSLYSDSRVYILLGFILALPAILVGFLGDQILAPEKVGALLQVPLAGAVLLGLVSFLRAYLIHADKKKFMLFYRALQFEFGVSSAYVKNWRLVLNAQNEDDILQAVDKHLIDLWKRVVRLEVDFKGDYVRMDVWEEARRRFKEAHAFFLSNQMIQSESWHKWTSEAEKRIRGKARDQTPVDPYDDDPMRLGSDPLEPVSPSGGGFAPTPVYPSGEGNDPGAH